MTRTILSRTRLRFGMPGAPVVLLLALAAGPALAVDCGDVITERARLDRDLICTTDPALGDAAPELRRQAVHLLATLHSDEARSAIDLAASDPDDTVRQAAEEALTRPGRRR